MINLCLVVIATQFSETKKREMERMRQERARYQSTSTLASTSASESQSCYRQIIKYIAHLWRRSKRRLLRRYRAYRSRQLQNRAPKSLTLRTRKKKRQSRRRHHRHHHHHHPNHRHLNNTYQLQQQQTTTKTNNVGILRVSPVNQATSPPTSPSLEVLSPSSGVNQSVIATPKGSLLLGFA